MKAVIKIFFLIIITCYTHLYGQINNFTLSVTPTSETCTANGKLTFSVANTLPGASILYSIYRLPNITTPISVTSVSPFTGLVAGTYRVIATQSLGQESATKQQDVVLENQIVNLTYQLTSIDEVCGNDGTITVTTTTGTAVGYEIISGPVLKPLQTSNVFTGLSAGVYIVRVYDNCNEAVVQTYQLFSKDPTLNLTLKNPVMAGCNLVNISFSITFPDSNGVIKYPLQVTTQVTSQSGILTTTSGVVSSGLDYSTAVPYYPQQPYNYSITIVDGCGISYTLNGVINNVFPISSYNLESQDCTHKKAIFNGVSEVTLITAPAGFNVPLPMNYTPQIINNRLEVLNLVEGTYVFNVTDVCGAQHVYTFNVIIDSPLDPYYLLYNRTCTTSNLLIFGIQGLTMVSAPTTYNVALPHDYTSLINSANTAAFNLLPIGVYQFNVIDLCGQPKPLTIVINPISDVPSATVLEGCDIGFGGIKIVGQITDIVMTSAPSTYTDFPLPHNFTFNLIGNATTFVLASLPAGIYVFQISNACGINYTITKEVFGYQENSMAIISPNCGSFNVNVVENSNTSSNTYWLQKWDITSNTWVHPATNVLYIEGTLPVASNSIPLSTGDNLNLNFIGRFRVLKAFKTYLSNSSIEMNCFVVLNEFDFTGQPVIESINSVSCGITFEVLVNAEGIGPFQYGITTKNGEPFIVENGSSNYFANLESAIYSFRVQDFCGNIVNRIFEIVNPIPINITASATTCDGSVFSLTVPNFSFLEYEWWKDNNTTNILSTTNEFTIASFNSNIHNGTYHVRIIYADNPNSCLNQELTYNITLNVTPPNAGQGSTIVYCGNQGNINLFSLLQGSYDNNGTWTEITNSGALTANFWNSSSMSSGIYQFKYRVDGSCNLFSEAFVSITLYAIPEAPVASVDSVVCETTDLNLYATTITNANYVWTGPNGFSSSQQNPSLMNISTIDNGFYTVYVTQNGCDSETSVVEVVVNPLPDFELIQECLNNEYVLTVIFDETQDNSFSWVGPDNFSSSQNPIMITRGETGIYSLSVTDLNGCSTTKAIDVLRTFCEIPNVITPNNDGSNDEFNLIGFDVQNLEIYNRWGRKVFDKVNYTNEWHGQSNKGEKLPDGTYFYSIQFNNSETTNGWVFVNGN